MRGTAESGEIGKVKEVEKKKKVNHKIIKTEKKRGKRTR